MAQGVYMIKNHVNEKVYVGSSRDLEKRKQDHFKAFESGKAVNRHLQYAVSKHGIHNFEFIVLEEVSSEHVLLEREQYWWSLYRDNCYNCYKPNLDPNELSRILSGRHFDEEHRKNLSHATKKWMRERGHPMKGKSLSDEAKFNMSESRKKFYEDHPSSNSNRIFTPQDVFEIRSRYMQGELVTAISKSLCLSRHTIGAMLNCKTYKEDAAFPPGYKEWHAHVEDRRKDGERVAVRGWKHTEDFKERFRKAVTGPRKKSRMLSDEQVKSIRQMKNDGHKLKNIADTFCISVSLVSAICLGKRYGDVV